MAKVQKIKRNWDGKIILGSVIYNHQWTPGIHKTKKRVNLPIGNGFRMSNEGFYVYLKKPKDSWSKSYRKYYRKYVTFYANIDDLLAIGSRQYRNENVAVFSKIELKKEDYQKAIGEYEEDSNDF